MYIGVLTWWETAILLDTLIKLLLLLLLLLLYIISWEMRIRNQVVQCKYENVVDELMRDQFVAGVNK